MNCAYLTNRSSVSLFGALLGIYISTHSCKAQHADMMPNFYRTDEQNSKFNIGIHHCAPAVNTENIPQPTKAVSLKNLLSSQPGPGSVLPGITKLYGFVEFEDDVILFGTKQENRSEIFLTDIIVAFQKALGRDFGDSIDSSNVPPAKKRNSRESSISIDPNQEYLKELDSVDLFSKAGPQNFQRICRAPQTVAVYNLPRMSRVVKVLVDADYRMKLVGQSQIKLPNNINLPGTFADTSASSEGEDKTKQSAIETADRFWFRVNEVSYKSDNDTVYLTALQVMLDTEINHISSLGSGDKNEKAEKFACAWTARMEEIIESEPIWHDMESVYRSFAIAQIYNDRNGSNKKQSALRSKIMNWEIDKFIVPDSIPGMSKIRQTRTKTGNGFKLSARSVCGGVSLGLKHIRKLDFTNAAVMKSVLPATVPSEKSYIYALVRVSMPNGNPISWNVGQLNDLETAWQKLVDGENGKLKAKREELAAKAAENEKIESDKKIYLEAQAEIKRIEEFEARRKESGWKHYIVAIVGLPIVVIIVLLYFFIARSKAGGGKDFNFK
ncbi:DUF1598 domain-containing protein [Methylobacterium sp. WL122]|nr:DUF1598 domain-containing protein [Methylobacterium sp. WL122]